MNTIRYFGSDICYGLDCQPLNGLDKVVAIFSDHSEVETTVFAMTTEVDQIPWPISYVVL